MAVYPIKNEGENGNTKFPMHTGNTEEFIRQRYDFYLKDELGHRYRLHAKNAHFTDDFLPYVVLCPRCSREMKCVGGPITLHELGLYECKCSKY